MSNLCTQTGDDALAARKEKISGYRFLPSTDNRIVHFQGKYILIVNQETGDQKTFEENIADSTPYTVPAGFTCYIRDATVSFEPQKD